MNRKLRAKKVLNAGIVAVYSFRENVVKNEWLAESSGVSTSNVAVADNPAASKVLRSTYRLLSATLVFSAIVALGSAVLRLPSPGLLLTLVGYLGFLFLTYRLRNSAWGLLSIFALTGFMGYTLGPILNAYMGLANGGALIATAMATTGAVFVGLSIYARSSRTIDMLRFAPFLMVGILVAFCLGLAAVVFQLPVLSLTVSGIVVLLMSALIMYETQNIIRGGETNYIMGTVTLFVAAFNLFSALLQIFGFMSGDEA